MFIKFKHKPDGSFDKTKARLVVQGNHEPDYGYGKTASKTIYNITVFTLFKIMTVKDLKSKVYDIPGAHLKTFHNHPIDFFIELPPAAASNWVELRPDTPDIQFGNKLFYLGMTVERDRTRKTSSISQYGCIEDLLLKYDADKKKEFDNPCAYEKNLILPHYCYCRQVVNLQRC